MRPPALRAGLACAVALCALPALAYAAAAAGTNARPSAAATAANSSRTAATKARSAARLPIHAVELAFELTPAQLTWPDAGASFMLVQPCAKCATQSLSIDAQSRFFLNDVALPLAELRRRIGSRGNWSATALYTPGELRLTRLLVVGP